MKEYFSIKNIFLFSIIVVLPVCVVFYSLNNMIEEQFLAIKDNISHDLRQQIARLEHTVGPEYHIEDFLDILVKQKKICRQNPKTIKNFIEKVDKFYPDAFKWLFLDENLNLLPVSSNRILEATKCWQPCLKGGFYVSNRLKDGFKENDYQEVFQKYMNTLNTLQKMMSPKVKVEQIFEYEKKVLKTKWLNRDCYVIWQIDGIQYNNYNRATKIAGACILVVFPEKLPENIWLKRTIVRRKKSKENFKYPIASINISDNIPFVIDSRLPNNGNFIYNLIKAYNSKTQELFEYNNYIVGTTTFDEESKIRILSFADVSKELIDKGYMQLKLSFTCIFLVFISTILALYIKHIKLSGISLQLRIALIFMIAIILPIISLISIGITFIVHEENRLRESAYVKMRSNIDSLSIRYKDASRLIERGLYDQIKNMLGSPPYDLNIVAKTMQKAVDEDLINQYVFFMDNKIASTSWTNLEPYFQKTLVFLSTEVLAKSGVDKRHKNIINDVIDDELKQLISTINDTYDFYRPSHLRHVIYLDQHLYCMTFRINIKDEVCPLFIYLSDKLVEQNFAKREFITNNPASKELPGSIILPELSFYSTASGSKNFPPESPIWTILGNALAISSKLKIEERGVANIGSETFLYLTKPINNMYTRSYQPCLLTSTKPIDLRIRDVKILLIALSSFAILGSILLSFALTTSLLVPIKKIDSAAQQIGKGNLNISLPIESKDELGRLSKTFNEMVEGLRERVKMRAYVSESVLEAVKDNSDQSIHAGKFIEATILFSDIRNFTGLSESHSPDKVFEVLNEFFGGIEPIIRMNYGRVDKYIGDAVMAIFHKTSPEQHAISAIKAAVRMKSFVSLMNQDRIKRGLFPIEIGVGISTGHVLLGDVGSRRRKDLTVIGDEVNLASRLESASKQGHYSKIIFSGQTYKFVENLVEAEKLPFEEIRGKKNAVQIYELIKFKNDDFLNLIIRRKNDSIKQKNT